MHVFLHEAFLYLTNLEGSQYGCGLLPSHLLDTDLASRCHEGHSSATGSFLITWECSSA